METNVTIGPGTGVKLSRRAVQLARLAEVTFRLGLSNGVSRSKPLTADKLIKEIANLTPLRIPEEHIPVAKLRRVYSAGFTFTRSQIANR